MTDKLIRSELPNVGIVVEMDEDDRRLLGGYGEFLPAQAGQTIITAGEDQPYLYLVISGLLHVTIQIEGRTKLVARVESGETLGEVNAFDPEKASATVTAQEFTQIWKASKSDIDEFVAAYPAAGASSAFWYHYCDVSPHPEHERKTCRQPEYGNSREVLVNSTEVTRRYGIGICHATCRGRRSSGRRSTVVCNDHRPCFRGLPPASGVSRKWEEPASGRSETFRRSAGTTVSLDSRINRSFTDPVGHRLADHWISCPRIY